MFDFEDNVLAGWKTVDVASLDSFRVESSLQVFDTKDRKIELLEGIYIDLLGIKDEDGEILMEFGVGDYADDIVLAELDHGTASRIIGYPITNFLNNLAEVGHKIISENNVSDAVNSTDHEEPESYGDWS